MLNRTKPAHEIHNELIEHAKKVQQFVAQQESPRVIIDSEVNEYDETQKSGTGGPRR